jgi:hypothetical protein
MYLEHPELLKEADEKIINDTDLIDCLVTEEGSIL